jgi:uncharacterized membrane protein YeaQ/YmgE (transglycosylase-associated protein family)
MDVPSLTSLRTDDSWRYPLVFGLASIPFTLSTYLQSVDNSMSLGAVTVAGLVAAYLYDGQQASSKRVGIRTGAVGAVATLVPISKIVTAFIGPVASSPLWFRVAAPVLALGLVVPVLVGLTILTGMVGGLFGGWLAKKTGRRRPPAVGS